MARGMTEAVELTKTITELVKKGVTLELQERIADLREAVLNAKDELIAQREANQQLREQIAQQANWESRAAAYSLSQTTGGAVVYQASKPFPHYACPNCFETKKQI